MAEYVSEAVSSVLEQTFDDFEFIILDDASEDETWDLLQVWSKRDGRIRLFRNEQNVGLTRSLNRSLSEARGEYIARQDGDDVSLPTRFEKQVAYLDRNVQVELVSSDVVLVDQSGLFLRRSWRSADPDMIAWYLSFYNHVASHSAAMFRRKTVANLGGYNEEFVYSQDHALWLQLSRLGAIVILPEALLKYRCRDTSISSTVRQEQERYSLCLVQNELSRLVGDVFTMKEVLALRDFWTRELRCFKDLPMVNKRLRQVSRGFLSERKLNEGSVNALRKTVARQFYDCSKRVNIRKRLWMTLAAWFYALQWHVRMGLVHGFRQTAMLPYDFFQAVMKRKSSAKRCRL
jgi:glycosyltransferase involved in cell wall biosynthesis